MTQVEEKAAARRVKRLNRIPETNTPMLTVLAPSGTARVSTYRTPAGTAESFACVESGSGRGIAEALDEVASAYDDLLKASALSPDTLVFGRLFLSDIENQKNAVLSSRLWKSLAPGAVSVVGQPCLRGGAAGLFTCHVDPGARALRRTTAGDKANPWRKELLLEGAGYGLLYNVNYEAPGAGGAQGQTEAIFGSLTQALERRKMALLDCGIRSWVFVRDIDNNYKGMVQARREFFARHDLTEKTRYLASTGIEGKSRSVAALVGVDMFSIAGLSPGQIVRMEARQNMSPTIDYGVTFERGLRVRFGDRSHLYVSGTASIDRKGEVLHLGDAAGQAKRTMDNVAALLAGQGASLRDLAYLIVYIRDRNNCGAVMNVVEPLLAAGTPVLAVEGAVCRPSWLMEVEGVAVTEDHTEYAPFL